MITHSNILYILFLFRGLVSSACWSIWEGSASRVSVRGCLPCRLYSLVVYMAVCITLCMGGVLSRMHGRVHGPCAWPRALTLNTHEVNRIRVIICIWALQSSHGPVMYHGILIPFWAFTYLLYRCVVAGAVRVRGELRWYLFILFIYGFLCSTPFLCLLVWRCPRDFCMREEMYRFDRLWFPLYLGHRNSISWKVVTSETQ